MKKVSALIGLAFLTIPLFGLAWSIMNFFKLKSKLYGMDMASAKVEMSDTLMTFGSGVFIGFLGILILGICIDGLEYRPKWLFWCMFSLSVIWICYFPAGTILGLALLIYSIVNRKKFIVIKNSNLSTNTQPRL